MTKKPTASNVYASGLCFFCLITIIRKQTKEDFTHFVSGTLVTIFGTCFVSTGRKVTSHRVSAHA